MTRLGEEDSKNVERLTLTLERHLIEGTAPPTKAHHFLLTRVGNDVLLEAGFFDLVELKIALDAAHIGDTSTVKLYVRERVILGRENLRQLGSAVEQILEAWDTERTGGSE